MLAAPMKHALLVCTLAAGCGGKPAEPYVYAPPDRVTVTVSPTVTTVGRPVRVTCHVPRHKDNRAVAWGLGGTSTSAREIHGESGPTIFTTAIERPPCGESAAFCVVRDTTRDVTYTAQLVVGCVGSPEEQ